MSERYRVTEKRNPLAVHCYAYSRESCQRWIDGQPDPRMRFIQPDGSYRHMQANEFEIHQRTDGVWAPVSS